MEKKERKRVLVTGATGFIGSHMVDFLVRLGHEVVATDIQVSKFLNPEAQFVQLDLRKKGSLKTLFKNGPFDYIFHIAAVFSYTASLNLLREVNVVGTKNLLWLIKECSPGAVVVVWSSGSVYGVTGHDAATEEKPTAPKNHYERSKLEEERLALEFGRVHGLKIIVIRPAAVYGERSVYGAALPIFQIAHGQIPFIIGPGNFAQSFVHVDDVVGAAYFLAERYETIGGLFAHKPVESRYVFNVNDDKAYTIEEMFLHVERCLRNYGRDDVRLWPIHYPIWGLKPLIWWNKFCNKFFNTKLLIEPDLIDYLGSPFLMSNAKLTASMGYELKWPDVKEGIRHTIAYYLREGVL